MRKLIERVSLLALLMAASVEIAAQSTLTTDLSITQAASRNPVIAGTLLDYAITVSNAGPDAADALEVIDTLPAAVTYESNTAACTASAGLVNCHLGALAAGESYSFTITVFVPGDILHASGSATTITNIATVDSSSSDPNRANNRSSFDLGVVASADLAILSVGVLNPPTELLAGESLNLTLQTVVSNNGSSAPMDSAFRAAVTASTNALIEPAEFQIEELALGLNESRTVENVFTVLCNGGGSQTLSFTSMIQPLREGTSDAETGNNSASVELSFDCLIPVEIDIRPDTEENSINLTANDEFQVVILSNEEFIFDATTIDPGTIQLAGATVSPLGNGAYKTFNREVNGDGLMDLLVYIQTTGLELAESDTTATLRASTFDGVRVTGTDEVQINNE
jgi:uncharacterized repeat protein (TIGR01451 family)